jgi:hypothetical protein
MLNFRVRTLQAPMYYLGEFETIPWFIIAWLPIGTYTHKIGKSRRYGISALQRHSSLTKYAIYKSVWLACDLLDSVIPIRRKSSFEPLT